MPRQEISRRHHYVPETLLKPWLVKYEGQAVLQGYTWEPRRNSLWCKRKGMNAFCNQLDLLTLRAHGLGRDAIERIFFGTIDQDGARARDRLLADGVSALNEAERADFARLLLSLDVRRPRNVEMVRQAVDHLVSELNNDPEIIAAMQSAGISSMPSAFYEAATGIHLDDRALFLIQKLVDSPTVGERLINSYWDIIKFNREASTLILADRPLIRTKAYDHPAAIWLLPLTPQAVFVAANHPTSLAQLRAVPTHRLARELNVTSAKQAERYVFSVSSSHEQWLPKYLSQGRNAKPTPPASSG